MRARNISARAQHRGAKKAPRREHVNRSRATRRAGGARIRERLPKALSALR